MSKLGLLIVGLGGGVGSTVAAGLALMRRELSPRLGMLSETGTIKLADGQRIPLRQHMGLPSLDEIVVGGWDITDRSVLDAARAAGVIPEKLLDAVAPQLSETRTMPAVFSSEFVQKIDGAHTTAGRTPLDQVDRLREQIREFKRQSGVDRLVIVNTASTEKTADPNGSATLNDPDAFARSLRDRAANGQGLISPAMLYFYAAILEGIPHVNFTPSQAEVPALRRLALDRKVLYSGKDGKTGQTLIKTVLAPAFRARQLKVDGWFSTNILGNNDGKVLSDPESLSSKIKTKESVLDDILGYRVGANYDTSSHIVTIHYYPPRGDAKEAWDNIDLSGFLGMLMQIKVNFLCRDSILAAPLVIDLARLIDHGAAAGKFGIFRPLSSFFKLPLHDEGEQPVHDFFAQRSMLAEYITGRPGGDAVELG